MSNLKEYPRNRADSKIGKIVIDRDLCIGGGACEYACPVLPEKAITVAGRRRHGRARKPDETKAAAPTPSGGFPF